MLNVLICLVESVFDESNILSTYRWLVDFLVVFDVTLSLLVCCDEFGRPTRYTRLAHEMRLVRDTVASKRNQHCRARWARSPNGWTGGGGASPYQPTKKSWERCKLPQSGAESRLPRVLVHFGSSVELSCSPPAVQAVQCLKWKRKYMDIKHRSSPCHSPFPSSTAGSRLPNRKGQPSPPFSPFPFPFPPSFGSPSLLLSPYKRPPKYS